MDCEAAADTVLVAAAIQGAEGLSAAHATLLVRRLLEQRQSAADKR